VASSTDPADPPEDPTQASLRRIRSLAPVTCHLSHDPEVVVIDP
jgi:hypothetical protein